MRLQTFALGMLAANCYLLGCGEGICCIFDIGESPALLLQTLKEQQLTVGAILLTHGHYDHIAGVEEVRALSGAPVYIHQADAGMLTDGRANLAYQLTDAPFRKVQNFTTVTDGDVLHVGSRDIQVLHTPGHTPGGVCYLTEEMLFSGDTLFCGSIGRTDFPGSDPAQMQNSLKKIATLPDALQVFPGHGSATDMAREKHGNPYLRYL